jgi:hypothetical protein
MDLHIRLSKRLSCLTIAIIAVSFSSVVFGEQVFDRKFFGVHVHRSVQNSLWKQVGFGAIRLHDNNVTWAELEPVKGGWQWDRLDKIIQNARSANVEVLLPLQATPTWAASDPRSAGAYGLGANTMPAKIEDWDAYVATIANRYKGTVAAYEVWNEPNLKQFFNGTPKEMAELTKHASEVIHRVDPAAKVVCSSITGSYGIDWLRKYIGAGAGKYCDVIGYHFYPHHQPPEKMLPIIDAVQKVLNEAGLSGKPLWNTETGWLISTGGAVDAKAAGFDSDAKVLNSDEAAAYVPRALLLSRYMGVDRFYWYAWDDASMGLSASRGEGWTRPAQVYADFQKLVSQSQLNRCQNTGALWQCQLQLRGGERLFVLWSDGNIQSVRSPQSGSLMGIVATGEIKSLRTIGKGESIQVNAEPVFIREVR